MNNIKLSQYIKSGNWIGIAEKCMDACLLPNKHFQDYVNNHFNLEGASILQNRHIEGLFCEIDGFKYALCDQLGTVEQAKADYDISDILPDDVVMDIGSNIGGFSIPISHKCKHVFAIEPLYADILRLNIEKNNIQNTTVLEMGLGTRNSYVQYGSKKKYVGMHKLSYLKQLCLMRIKEPVTFLKIDCEGSVNLGSGEFCIMPGDLTGIRAIEAEIHHYEGRPKRSPFEDVITEAGFKYRKEDSCQESILIHARRS